MTIDRRAVTPAALALAAGLMTPAAAQNAQDTPPPPRGLESLAPQSVPVPPAPVIVLPTQTPGGTGSATPERTTPRTRPTRPASEPAREPSRSSSPTPAPTPGARPTRTPEQPATPAPTTVEPQAQAPVETPAPAPTAAPTAPPAATPQAEPTIAAPETGRTMPIWILPAVIVLVLAGLWALTRRRREPAEPFVEPEVLEATPTPEPVAVAPVATAPVAPTPVATAPAAPKFLERPVPAAPRARLGVEMRPRRAGLNLLSAVAECELVITNTGDAPAEGIRTQVSLLTAHTGLDADLAALTAAPIGRPSTPPFALAPGESRTVKAIAATPRDAIQTMTAANRPMFVPVVAVNLLYPDGQTTRAWAIGIERVDSAKLAPFWLDAAPKMYADIGARPHAAAFER
ncbi:hypothetical protein FSB78_11320 [Sphingomonas ginsenosidivorax]|uniref:LPXTG cell wall anchor domain-containing protein n=1 Tax=Sphingomonas ginsenosidivorax TaxID=862135 RepID=A0A5C6UH04_9SPHN|nr:hypothetical protein [Sphingomonas ginsenosidivorax]TXC71466.1 hypothetical protein FSB78_11320 [Sphingomonas ginsenosidivorax]